MRRTSLARRFCRFWMALTVNELVVLVELGDGVEDQSATGCEGAISQFRATPSRTLKLHTLRRVRQCLIGQNGHLSLDDGEDGRDLFAVSEFCGLAEALLNGSV